MKATYTKLRDVGKRTANAAAIERLERMLAEIKADLRRIEDTTRRALSIEIK